MPFVPAKVGLGSGSVIKIDAVKSVLSSSVEVLAYFQAQSGVPPQPIGQAETEKGAFNRASEAKAAFPDADCWIGIENGMWSPTDINTVVDEKDASKQVMQRLLPDAEPVACANCDGAAIVVLLGEALTKEKQTDKIVVWSAMLPIPVERPFPKGPNGEWSVLKDPHGVLTNHAKPRAMFLTEALREAFSSL